MKSDIEISREARGLPIVEIGSRLAIPRAAIVPFGAYKAKISPSCIPSLEERPVGKLVLVTAITPTPAGEGKTTTTIGLGDALNSIGEKTLTCLREPSLGPCFGVKGGATGGGYAQVIPMEDINLHFTGDFHAITAANNLLSAMIDNHIHWGNALEIDPRRISWKRVLDINDRSLRHIVTGLGGTGNGIPREDRFDITAASEVMAIFCLAQNLQDLERRLGNIVVAHTYRGTPVTAADLGASGSMAALLRDAFMPNLVQTLENNPVFVHGGPFANIAHGCNSVIATRIALKLADYVVTEAGFGADLGAEKFFNIKCRVAKLHPSMAVIVVTIRALKMHGGVAVDHLNVENIEAIHRGYENLSRHITNLGKFGVPIVVAINHFSSDTHAEIETLRKMTESLGVKVILCSHWENGSQGAVDLARYIADCCESQDSDFRPLYDDGLSLWEKVERIAKEIYGASGISAHRHQQKKFAQLQDAGYGSWPVCIAKTQYSFSTIPELKGAPSGHNIEIRDVRLSAGAEFVVVVAGDMMTMPGLPRRPAAHDVHLDNNGDISGIS